MCHVMAHAASVKKVSGTHRPTHSSRSVKAASSSEEGPVVEGTTGAVASTVVRAKVEGAALRTNDALVSRVRVGWFNTRSLPHGR
jgi:hypothetical protein